MSEKTWPGCILTLYSNNKLWEGKVRSLIYILTINCEREKLEVEFMTLTIMWEE